MSIWTDAATVRQVLEDLWSGDKIHDENWNVNLKTNTLTLLRDTYGYDVSEAEDSCVVVAIEDDPWSDHQFNDDKLRNQCNEKYVLVIPHPTTEEQFVSWSKELAILHAIYENSDMTVRQGL